MYMPNRTRRTALTASVGPLTSTRAACGRPNRLSSSSPGGPAMRTVGSPRRARTVWAVPAHWSSSPTPRSRRARNHGARLTLRHSGASIAGEFVRGPRPLALRTSSWWTKNSLRLAKRRTQPMRKKPGGGPDRIVATSQGKSSCASAVLGWALIAALATETEGAMFRCCRTRRCVWGTGDMRRIARTRMRSSSRSVAGR